MSYIPEAGDLVWLLFDPVLGREQAGRRPALVLSPRAYNRNELMLVVPITSHKKGYPFEVDLLDDSPFHGVILADQIRCMAWTKRKIAFVGKASPVVRNRVRALLMALLGHED
jgi:mRNA interferase MazF